MTYYRSDKNISENGANKTQVNSEVTEAWVNMKVIETQVKIEVSEIYVNVEVV